jgi:hypothetical protein
MNEFSRIEWLKEKYPDIPLPILVKADLFFQGVTFTPELAEAGEWAIPNYQPYRFEDNEDDPTGKGVVGIPYLMTLADGSLVRILGNRKSSYKIVRKDSKHVLTENDKEVLEIEFQKKPDWFNKTTSDGTPMAATGISQHGDMLILNPAPGCEFFLHQNETTKENYRCKFCHYGVPDKRSRQLGQEIGRGEISEEALDRLMQVCEEAIPHVSHVYLVSGSMVDNDEEGKRYLQLAKAVQEVNSGNIPVCCGSSSLKRNAQIKLREAGVTGCCFNLEVWNKSLWETVCPGKEKFIGRDQWIQGLIDGVDVFGRGNVMSAFVAGIEFAIEDGFDNMDDAMQASLEGTEWLAEKGILSLYSVQWPITTCFPEKDPQSFVQDYFIKLNIAQHAVRQKHNLMFPNDFVCHGCTYMQLECDFDHHL